MLAVLSARHALVHLSCPTLQICLADCSCFACVVKHSCSCKCKPGLATSPYVPVCNELAPMSKPSVPLVALLALLAMHWRKESTLWVLCGSSEVGNAVSSAGSVYAVFILSSPTNPAYIYKCILASLSECNTHTMTLLLAGRPAVCKPLCRSSSLCSAQAGV